jgi:hypothetical protein
MGMFSRVLFYYLLVPVKLCYKIQYDTEYDNPFGGTKQRACEPVQHGHL